MRAVAPGEPAAPVPVPRADAGRTNAAARGVAAAGAAGVVS